MEDFAVIESIIEEESVIFLDQGIEVELVLIDQFLWEELVPWDGFEEFLIDDELDRRL